MMGTTLGDQAVTTLSEIGLFGGLDENVLRSFGGSLALIQLGPGEIVFREGENGREMFVLLDGEAEIIKHSKQKREARVAIFGPGDWFGDMSILDIMPRSATVRTIAPSRLLRISAHDLDTLYRTDLKAYALFVLNIARELSRRLRVADGLLADLIVGMIDHYPNRRS